MYGKVIRLKPEIFDGELKGGYGDLYYPLDLKDFVFKVVGHIYHPVHGLAFKCKPVTFPSNLICQTDGTLYLLGKDVEGNT